MKIFSALAATFMSQVASQQTSVSVDITVTQYLKTSCQQAKKPYVLQVSGDKLYATHGYGTKNAHSHEVLDLTNGGAFTSVRWYMSQNGNVIKTDYTSGGSRQTGEIPIGFLFTEADKHNH